MNFIFDIGEVLVDFKPLVFLNKWFCEQPTIDKMYETIFKAPEWERFDQGTMTHEDACNIFCMREPDFQAEIRHIMQNVKDILTPNPDTIALLSEVKRAGYKLYYLSNMHKELKKHLLETCSFFELFDGGIFSCDIQMTKPSAGIYLYLLEKYQLDSRECLFFDDREENVESAHKVGIHGVLFTGAECVKPFLGSAV